MHPSQFDALSWTLADGVSRRQALTRFGAAGLLAGLTAALGHIRAQAAVPAPQAETCRLETVASVRIGPTMVP